MHPPLLAPLTAAADPSSGGLFGWVADWAVQLMTALGPIGAGIIVLLENVFPPIPSEIILPLAGFTASPAGGAAFTVVEAVLWTTIGSVVGAYLLYGLGRLLGHDRTVWLFDRIPFVDSNDITKTVTWFAKHGKKAVFFGRMLPIFRSLISIPAGIEKMPVLRFGLLTAAGSLIWNTAFVSAGYFLGTQWAVVEQYANILQYVVIAVVALLIVWWIVSKVRKYRSVKAAYEAAARNELTGGPGARAADDGTVPGRRRGRHL